MDSKPLSPVSTDTPPALALDALAAAINADHDAVEQMARSTLDRARAAGDKLLQAKAQVAHGQWLPWLAEHCPRMSERTAQAYMKLAREWEVLMLKNADSAHLTLDGALKLLAAPEEPAWAKGLTPDERAELDRAAANIKAHHRQLVRCLDDMGGHLRAIRDGNGWKALGFVSMEAFAEFGHNLDAEMLGYLLDPPTPWQEATDAMHAAHVRWILRQQGLSDTDARAQMAQWDAEYEAWAVAA